MLKGVQYLRGKLAQKQIRVRQRYLYYEMKDGHTDPSPTIPPRLREMYHSSLGWCAKGVDFLADRLAVSGFENDTAGIGAIYRANNIETLSDAAILGALIASCSFVYISMDGGTVRMQTVDASNATGCIDPATGFLSEGYAVLDRNDSGEATLEAYFEPGKTTYYKRGAGVMEITNPAPYPLLVPVIYRPDAVRPFGHSRISRACMDLQDAAVNTIMRAEVSAEFYSFPQKYVVGTSAESEPIDKWGATISSLIEITKDSDGDKPQLGQFVQQNVEPHISQFRLYAAAFCGETGLTLDDIGFVSDNPSSAEAIKAAHEALRSSARKAQRTFGRGFINAGYLAACLRDGIQYKPDVIADTRCLWLPLVEPDSSTMSLVGDAILKINQASPGFFNDERISQLLGIKGGGADA